MLPGAEPFTADARGGRDIGIAVIHGFTGSPKSVVPWGQALAEQGWAVRVPRLPGHGTRWQDMNITTWQDWYAEVDRTVTELAARHQRVFVMGLSMGGSLALRAAQMRPDQVAGLVLVNPAVHSERPDRFLLPALSKVIGSFPGISNDIAKPGMDEGAYDRLPLRAAHSLTKLWGAVKSDIDKVTQPMLLFRSRQDHVVEPSNAAWIMRHVPSTDKAEVVLERSYHVATMDHDADVIVDGSIAFVQRLAG